MSRPLADAIVKIAVRMLPTGIRARYSEQWLADLRDAAEAGVADSQIAFGSLKFALTLKRPMFARAFPTTNELIVRRSRFAVALALSAALLAISQYASIINVGGLTGNSLFDFGTFFGTALLAGYAILAPVAAIALASATRGMSVRVRWGVWMLALASCAGIGQILIDLPGGNAVSTNIYSTPGMTMYLIALALTAGASAIVWSELRRPSDTRSSRRRGLVAALVGATVVWAGVAVSVAVSASAWNSRTPLVFGDPVTATSRAQFEEWTILEALSEQRVLDVLITWAVAGAIAGGALAAFAIALRMSVPQIVGLTLAAISVLMISNSAVLTFLALMSSGFDPLVPSAVLLLVGRIVLIAIILAQVGGVRFEPGVSGRTQQRAAA